MNNKHIEATANLLDLTPEQVEHSIKLHLEHGTHGAVFDMYLTVIKVNAMKDIKAKLDYIGEVLRTM